LVLYYESNIIVSIAQQPVVVQGFLIIEASRSYLDTLHSVGLYGRVIARGRSLYLTTHNTHMRQTSMHPAGFERAVPTRERQQTDALGSSHCGRLVPWQQTPNLHTVFTKTWHWKGSSASYVFRPSSRVAAL